MYERTAQFAGSFYPARADVLRDMVAEFTNVPVTIQRRPLAIVVPHAGYVYSGVVAGRAYAAVKGYDYQRVIILCPSHRARFDGVSVIPEGILKSPLGNLEIDSEFVSSISESMMWIKQIDEIEHSYEVQLPFLKTVVPGARIVPMIMGSDNIELCHETAVLLNDALTDSRDKTLIVISTDLSHYHEGAIARKMDLECIRLIEEGDIAALKQKIDCGQVEACGIAGLYVMMHYSQLAGGLRLQNLAYAHSGDTSGDNTRVVGYFAGAYVEG